MDKQAYIAYLQDVVTACQRFLFYEKMHSVSTSRLNDVDWMLNRTKQDLESDRGSKAYKEELAVEIVASKPETIPFRGNVISSLFSILKESSGFRIALGVFLFSSAFTVGGFVERRIDMIIPFSIIAIIPLIILIICTKNDYVYEKEQIDKINYEKLSLYQNRVDEVNGEIRKLSSEIAEKEAAIATLTQQKDALEKDTAAIDNLKQQAKSAMDAYFSVNLLYPTYHTYDAVTYILQYLLSGRCEELTGPDGAYNKYELEKRLDKMIDSLGALNQSINAMIPIMRSIAQSTSAISANTASIASSSSAMVGSLQNVCNTIETQNSLISNLEGSLNNINGSLSQIREIETVNACQNEQMLRLSQYQDFATKQQRLETGHWT